LRNALSSVKHVIIEKIFGGCFLRVLYKIIDTAAWHQAEVAGVFKGAAIDLKDGYIHLSAAAQVKETARLHFAGATNLLLVAIDEAVLSKDLKWEASRGGQLFPHVYGHIDPINILWAKPLPWNGEAHLFPPEVI
jgi:uncharacterized protein (DUF952 family)